jgi:hypothetical protein
VTPVIPVIPVTPATMVTPDRLIPANSASV